MIESSLKAVCIKAGAAAGLFAGAWLLTVRPADASLSDRTGLLQAQSRAIGEHADRTATADPTAATLEHLTAHAERFAGRLTLHQTDASIFDAIGSAASGHGVSVHRIDPRPTPRRSRFAPNGGAGPDAVGVTASEFLIELSGTYGAVVALLDTFQETLGLSRIVEIRLAAAAAGQVRGVIGLAIYRAPSDATIIPEPDEGAQDDT